MEITHICILNKLCEYFIAGTTLSPGPQTVRVAPSGATVLKATGQGTTVGGKQIITVHKAGSTGTNQSQIVTLVKTTQGMTMTNVSNEFVGAEDCILFDC